MRVTVYVEGGGNTRELRQKCRRGFSEFFSRAGLTERMPRIVSCGGRSSAYDKFSTALTYAKNENFMVLLVDSEGPVAEDWGAWFCLRASDKWEQPEGATEDNAHLMVQCMEAWFLADKDLLEKFFGAGFNRNALPARRDVENVLKVDIDRGLNRATRRCKTKGVYRKGRHSFEILAELDTEKVIAASGRAKRLVDTLLSKTS